MHFIGQLNICAVFLAWFYFYSKSIYLLAMLVKFWTARFYISEILLYTSQFILDVDQFILDANITYNGNNKTCILIQWSRIFPYPSDIQVPSSNSTFVAIIVLWSSIAAREASCSQFEVSAFDHTVKEIQNKIKKLSFESVSFIKRYANTVKSFFSQDQYHKLKSMTTCPCWFYKWILHPHL